MVRNVNAETVSFYVISQKKQQKFCGYDVLLENESSVYFYGKKYDVLTDTLNKLTCNIHRTQCFKDTDFVYLLMTCCKNELINKIKSPPACNPHYVMLQNVPETLSFCNLACEL
jgi:hypothetical protein